MRRNAGYKRRLMMKSLTNSPELPENVPNSFGNQDGTLVKPGALLYITPFDDYDMIATKFRYGSRNKL